MNPTLRDYAEKRSLRISGPYKQPIESEDPPPESETETEITHATDSDSNSEPEAQESSKEATESENSDLEETQSINLDDSPEPSTSNARIRYPTYKSHHDIDAQLNTQIRIYRKPKRSSVFNKILHPFRKK